ncbi:MAG TPA: hypothetical protein VF656_16680 [Pyrinomonadaceae bacterium]|jgi:cell shape-determining protein MreC
MSKVFFCLASLFSAFMLFVAVSGSSPSRPRVMLFWLVVGVSSVYKLFKSPSKA